MKTKILAATLLSIMGAGAGHAQTKAQPTATPSKNAAPVVVELFTSQSCSSCYSAATHFAELADRDDIVALSWHVDYWNALQTSKGRWQDPYSKADYSQRQRDYNLKIRGRASVYTPQMVIDGEYETIGSAKRDVAEKISMARKNQRAINFSASEEAKELIVTTAPGDVPQHASVVYFIPTTKTTVERGENAGRSFTNRNIVTNMVAATLAAGDTQLSAPMPKDGEQCAILFRADALSPVTNAAYCPAF